MRYFGVVLLVLAGCAFEPVVQSSTPETIVIRGETLAPPEANRMAAAHCAKYGREARFETGAESGYVARRQASIYRCIP